MTHISMRCCFSHCSGFLYSCIGRGDRLNRRWARSSLQPPHPPENALMPRNPFLGSFTNHCVRPVSAPLIPIQSLPHPHHLSSRAHGVASAPSTRSSSSVLMTHAHTTAGWVEGISAP